MSILAAAALRAQLQWLQPVAASGLSCCQHTRGLKQGSSYPSGAATRHFAADADPQMIIPVQKQQQQHQPPVSLQRQEVALELPDSNKGPWERVIDKPSGQPYYWNAKTGVTTPVGASRPDAWVAVVDQQTQAKYYWNKESGETTAVGEPLPGPDGRLQAAATDAAWQHQFSGRPSTASILGNSLAVGFGVGLVFAIIRLVF